MISFENDYAKMAHPAVLQKFVETNMEAAAGYGTDIYSDSAKEKILKACQSDEAQVFFGVGGTQTNQLVISTMLADCEGVVSADTGHINGHEGGAIEYSGHKVLTLPGHMGKLHADDLHAYLERYFGDHSLEHVVQPGMVYISQPTEFGSLYSKQEMEDIAKVSHSFGLPLFIDGARMAYGLASDEADYTLADITRIADVFYIGGTKCGAFCGEAIVFCNHNMPKYFVTLTKQRGGVLAKGKIVGLQFDVLFTDDLYLECGKHAIRQAKRMVQMLKDAGVEFYYESPTNQQFVLLKNEDMKALQEKIAICYWDPYDEERSIVRFVTSWGTTDEDLEVLQQSLQEVLG